MGIEDVTVDQARQLAGIRRDRGIHASAAVQEDLGAVVLTGGDYSTVCRALLDAQRLLRDERRAASSRQLAPVERVPLEVELDEAYEAVKSAQGRMP